jgi:hypothetical protein
LGALDVGLLVESLQHPFIANENANAMNRLVRSGSRREQNKTCCRRGERKAVEHRF